MVYEDKWVERTQNEKKSVQCSGFVKISLRLKLNPATIKTDKSAMQYPITPLTKNRDHVLFLVLFGIRFFFFSFSFFLHILDTPLFFY